MGDAHSRNLCCPVPLDDCGRLGAVRPSSPARGYRERVAAIQSEEPIRRRCQLPIRAESARFQTAEIPKASRGARASSKRGRFGRFSDRWESTPSARKIREPACLTDRSTDRIRRSRPGHEPKPDE